MIDLAKDFLVATAELTFELAARTIDLVADCGNRRTIAALEHRLRVVERRLADAEREVEASRRVDRARVNEIERLRAGRYWS